MKTIIVDLQQAYEEKKLMVSNPNKYWRLQRYKELKKKGLCVRCGRKKLTKYQKKNKIETCQKCRIKQKERRER